MALALAGPAQTQTWNLEWTYDFSDNQQGWFSGHDGWVGHYALLGPYDFMDIYDAPNVETAHKVSLVTRAEGAVSAESWQAMPYDKFIQLLEEVEP